MVGREILSLLNVEVFEPVLVNGFKFYVKLLPGQNISNKLAMIANNLIDSFNRFISY